MDTSISPLLIAQAQEDGSHSGRRYSRDVEQGKLMRLRRGIYVPTEVWVTSTPSQRHRLLIGAISLHARNPLFCRESALSLHGIPLLSLPQRIHIRASSPGRVRTVRQRSLTGQVSAQAFWERARNHGMTNDDAANPSLLFRGFDTAKHPVLALTTSQSVEIPLDLPGSDPGSMPRPVARSERLDVALADTLPKIDFPHAVVALEGALSAVQQRVPTQADDVRQAAEQILTSARAWRRLERVLGLASPLSESPGESLARVRFHELGVTQPQQQVMLRVDGETYRLDFLWEDAGVVGEFDGWMKYREGFDQAHRNEKLREDAIRSTGLRVLRFYWEDLMEPGCRRLLNLLARAGVLPPPGMQVFQRAV